MLEEKYIRKTRLFSRLLERLNKCKELEEIVIKASKEIRTKDELIVKWKAKCESFEQQLSNIKNETDERIEELESDMEKLLQEKKESDSKHKRESDDLRDTVENLKKDWKHYSDLLQTCEDNWNTVWKDKIESLNGNIKLYLSIIEKLSIQSNVILKAQQVIQKLNEENKDLIQQLESLTKQWDQLDCQKDDWNKLNIRIENYK